LVYLPIIYAEGAGLGLAVTGAALFFARIIDITTDPLIGILAQRIRTPWGRFKPIIFVGCIIGAGGISFLLNPPPEVGFFYLVVWASFLYLGWTMVNIPYLAWGAALSNDYGGRTQITSIREACVLLGIVVAGAVPGMSAIVGIGESEAISLIGWIVIGIGAILFALLLKGVHEPTYISYDHKSAGLIQTLKGFKLNKPFRHLLIAWFVNSLANGIPAVLFILFMKHVLQANELERGLITFSYFFAAILGIPLWLRLSKHFGKHRTWCYAMLIAVAAFSFVPILDARDILLFSFVSIISGFTLGADLAIPPSMQADVAEYESFISGQDRTPLMFSLWSATTKVAFAFSALLALVGVERIGSQVMDGEIILNNFVLSVIYSVFPVVLKLFAILIVWHHPITHSFLLDIRKRTSND